MIAATALLLVINGGALFGDKLYTWGSEIAEWTLPSLHRRVLVERTAAGEGGCVDDRGAGLFLEEAGNLVYRRAPDWRPRVLDHGISMHDCVAATLLGHRGVLMIQRGMQLRLYEYPGFHYTEIYSFYSGSRQGGLVLTDVDGDGHTDILCGNYWVRSPDRFDLPWHIHAINIHNTTPEAATFRLSLAGEDLIAAQGELDGGHVWRFHKPPDARQEWIESDYGVFHRPKALAGLLWGENNGPGSGLFEDGWRTGSTTGLHTALLWRGRYVLIGTENVQLR